MDDAAAPSGLLAQETPGDNAAPLSVSAISALLKRTVEDRFGYVRVRGEISGAKRAASGHFYFSLKDDGARLDAVMWKGQAGRLAFVPEDGVEVIVRGRLTTYPGRSNYQIVVEAMEVAGEGALLALLARLTARLAAEGLFDAGRKRPLPYLPRVIGVVTSPTGAVIRDILHRLADRCPTHVLVWPVLVQGEGAAAQVAAAVSGFSAMPADGPLPRPDVVIVARGGGSVEDLWAFNDEAVVRAIAASTIPVISAVGHETDTTLADHAADLRAPTPTAAAELAVPVREELVAALGALSLRSRRAVTRGVALGRERLAARSQRLPDPLGLVGRPAQALDEANAALRRALAGRAYEAEKRFAGVAGRLSMPLLSARLAQAGERLARARATPVLLSRRHADAAAQLAAATRMMVSLNPDNVLARGYARVSGAAGQPVIDAGAAAREAALTLHFRDGTLRAHPEGGPDRRPAERRKPRGSPAGQTDLFG